MPICSQCGSQVGSLVIGQTCAASTVLCFNVATRSSDAVSDSKGHKHGMDRQMHLCTAPSSARRDDPNSQTPGAQRSTAGGPKHQRGDQEQITQLCSCFAAPSLSGRLAPMKASGHTEGGRGRNCQLTSFSSIGGQQSRNHGTPLLLSSPATSSWRWTKPSKAGW